MLKLYLSLSLHWLLVIIMILIIIIIFVLILAIHVPYTLKKIIHKFLFSNGKLENDNKKAIKRAETLPVVRKSRTFVSWCLEEFIISSFPEKSRENVYHFHDLLRKALII